MRNGILISLLALSGCSGGNTGGHHVESDSAGVAIITSTAPAWGDSAKWSVSLDPVLDIGKLDGAPEYLFSSAHSPTRLSDGRIAVGDMGSSELRYYDARGNFLMRRGREGQGPGEWDQLYQMRRGGGDSIHVIEPPNEHSVFSPEGEYVRRFTLQPVVNRPNIWAVGRLANETMLAFSLARAGDRVANPNAKGEERTIGRDTSTRPTGFYREQYMHFLYDMQGRVIDSIGLLPGRMAHGSGAQAPFLARGLYAVRDDTLYFALGDTDEIRLYSTHVATEGGPTRQQLDVAGTEARHGPGASMRLQRIIRRAPDPELQITPDIIAAYNKARRAELARVFRNRPGFNVDAAVAETPFPDRMPAQSKILVDATGHIWTQEYVFPGKEDAPSRWSVYDRRGRWLGKLELPARFTVSEIGEDYVLGVWRDPEDVQHVRMYGLRRSP
jgi:hypothetical protein